ncbi:DUF2069 domain-containing protein [Undibacterium sp. Jales W-56]|uniref:DUF2069 domain-containing protein n=1 Tax=Undibacterium sp. Jales W-56 TaxID=2897325 RepID=UPI0021CE8B43|nr:DUF2069 domain-containing protein [Undibacterium sp. Jales W-56]MCU6433253.1 DUF2069 domain-containing protein [Undibacterium sp. Jales W-56]
MNPSRQSIYYYLTCFSLIALIVLLISWETLLAPLRPGGSWMVLKVIPILIPLRGILKKQIYTMQWSSMLILLYFTEGVVRAFSDKTWLSSMLAGLEIALTVLFFFACVLYLKPYKKAARAAAKDQPKVE